MDKFFDRIEDIITWAVTTLLFLVPVLATIWIVLAWGT